MNRYSITNLWNELKGFDLSDYMFYLRHEFPEIFWCGETWVNYVSWQCREILTRDLSRSLFRGSAYWAGSIGRLDIFFGWSPMVAKIRPTQPGSNGPQSLESCKQGWSGKHALRPSGWDSRRLSTTTLPSSWSSSSIYLLSTAKIRNEQKEHV